jgi:hypothetical protein
MNNAQIKKLKFTHIIKKGVKSSILWEIMLCSPQIAAFQQTTQRYIPKEPGFDSWQGQDAYIFYRVSFHGLWF